MIAAPISSDAMLSELNPGMRVFDIDRHPVGTIQSVYLTGLRPAHPDDWDTPVVVQTIAGTFLDDHCLPELLVVRLGRTGFAHVRDIHASGLHYLVTPQQIQQIDARGAVILKVPASVITRY